MSNSVRSTQGSAAVPHPWVLLLPFPGAKQLRTRGAELLSMTLSLWDTHCKEQFKLLLGGCS